MTLNERKQAILAAIIKTHILTGEPVGSKTLCNTFDFGLSSATLRNEMSELCELGFLEQPHTSAGRIPSSLGYRIYVDALLPKISASEEIKSAVDRAFDMLPCDPEYIPKEATRLLSELTGLTAINATIVSDTATVKRTEVIPLGRKTVMLMLIASDGNAKSRICRVSDDIKPQTLSLFARLLAEKIEGVRLPDITPAYIQTVISSAGVDAFSVISLMSAVFGIINDLLNSKITISGESNLFKNLKNDAAAGRLLEYMTSSESVVPLLKKATGTVNILFGDETDVVALKPSCMIVTSYGPSGRIGVIGPTRMAYDNIIPSIEYFAHRLGNAITEALEDMEVR